MLIKCTCNHQFQDEVYGKNMRVTTPVNKSKEKGTNKLREVRCTVCGKTHQVSSNQ